MFRSIIKENVTELKSISKSVKKIGKFQGSLDGEINDILKQNVGEVRKTLPTVRMKMDDCLKKVGDTDLCTIVIGKYNKFYVEVCQATPALCDDHQAPFIEPISSIPRVLTKKKETLRI